MSRKERIKYQKEIISQKYINFGLLLVSILSLAFSSYTFYSTEIYKKGEFLTISIEKYQGSFQTYVMTPKIDDSISYIGISYNIAITNTGDKPVTLTTYDIYKATNNEPYPNTPLILFYSNDEDVKFPLVISPKNSFFGHIYLSVPISKEVVRLLEDKYNFNSEEKDLSSPLDFHDVYKYLASNNYDIYGSKLEIEKDEIINEFYLDSEPFYYFQFKSTEDNHFGARIGRYNVKTYKVISK